MADSIRKLITDAILMRLTGGLVPSKRINKNRRIPIGRHDLPMYSVYFIHEAPTPVGNPRKPVILDRKLLVETRIIVEGDDDAADPHCQWIIEQLGSGEPLRDDDGNVITMAISESETIFEPLEGSEGSILITAIRWFVEYRTAPGDITRMS
jgi:hypothetical protein